ncbi:hypothetical protein JCM3770_006849 [Rhodotorula araucariae]
MQLEQIREDLAVLQASLIGEGELRWMEDDTRIAWEPVLADGGPVSAALPLPTLSLRLADAIDLSAEYRPAAKLPDFSLHSLTLGREDQARLRRELDRVVDRVQDEGSSLPVFTVYAALQEYLSANPPSATGSSRARSAEAQAEAPPAPPVGPFQLKTTLLWSHHLLATSKRKDIVAWSTELGLYGISKPGYPGVIIVEGLASNVDEFVHRIKQLQWKALQVRCELDGPLVDAPLADDGVGAKDAPGWAVRRKSHLGPVLDPRSVDKVCVKEVETLHEVGELMRAAGLWDVFTTALKLNK